ncbi:MAG: 2-C-methyl-D-erythritol 4-phosphate cytidylyltransferase [Fibrobacterota bacterium]
MDLSVVIVAGGMGRRLGTAVPKAFVKLGGIPLFAHSARLFARVDEVREIIISVPAGYERETRDLYKQYVGSGPPVQVIAGGAQRWISVQRGVEAAQKELVLIHDAARPFVTGEVVKILLDELDDAAGIITATPVTDTIRTFSENYCAATVDRSTLIAVGTPQVFRRSKLAQCYARAAELTDMPTDEAMLLEAFGIPVKHAPGQRINFKVTDPDDFRMAEAICAQRRRNED